LRYLWSTFEVAGIVLGDRIHSGIRSPLCLPTVHEEMTATKYKGSNDPIKNAIHG
jgi:hypothetical protein